MLIIHEICDKKRDLFINVHWDIYLDIYDTSVLAALWSMPGPHPTSDPSLSFFRIHFHRRAPISEAPNGSGPTPKVNPRSATEVGHVTALSLQAINSRVIDICRRVFSDKTHD